MPSRLAFLVVSALLALLAAPPLALAGPADEAKEAEQAKDWGKAADRWAGVLARSFGREAALGLARATAQGAVEERFREAEEALQKCLEAKADDREAILALGDLYIAIARAKTDPQAMNWSFQDAKGCFEKLVAKDARDEAAAVGLARTLYWMASFDEALGVLETFLAQGPGSGQALYWKGQVHYTQATDAYTAAGSVDDRAREAFQKAKEAYEQATKADAGLLDGWMQLGYACQYLGDLAAAQAAYEKAMDLDPHGVLPLKGIEALYYHRQAEYLPALKDLARTHPTNVAVHFFLGFRHLFEKKYDDAARNFETWMARGRSQDAAWTWLGQAYEGAGKAQEAAEAFAKALAANAGDEVAAAGVERGLSAEWPPTRLQTPQDALAAAKAWEKLLAAAPANPWICNNIAFLLRDAIDRQGRGQTAWKPVLDECVRLYLEAARRAEEQVAGREASLPYSRRHDYAGVLNDAGLMFQFYPEIRDLPRAEEFYVRALQLTDDGYGDAFANLVAIYLEQERWQEAYDLARDCAESLRDASEAPHENRERARQVMQGLVKEGKVEGD